MQKNKKNFNAEQSKDVKGRNRENIHIGTGYISP